MGYDANTSSKESIVNVQIRKYKYSVVGKKCMEN